MRRQGGGLWGAGRCLGPGVRCSLSFCACFFVLDNGVCVSWDPAGGWTHTPLLCTWAAGSGQRRAVPGSASCSALCPPLPSHPFHCFWDPLFPPPTHPLTPSLPLVLSFGRVYVAKWNEATVAVKLLLGTAASEANTAAAADRVLSESNPILASLRAVGAWGGGGPGRGRGGRLKHCSPQPPSLPACGRWACLGLGQGRELATG